MALHIPWDRVDDFGELATRAHDLGLELGAINPNLFQDPDYKLGSLSHHDDRVRHKAIEQMLECVAISQSLGSPPISLWLADGTNYPGQDSLRSRRERLLDSLRAVYAEMPEPMELLVEYKLFEPAFYSTDIADWGSALLICQALGDRAKVLVDLGHHAQGTTSSRSSPCSRERSASGVSISTTASTEMTISSSGRRSVPARSRLR